MTKHTISHADSFFAGAGLNPALGKRGLPAMLPLVEEIGTVTASANAIALAQQTAGAANLLLNGAIGNGDIGHARNITITVVTANLSATTFTIRGRDANGYPQACTMAGPNDNTVSSPKTFRWIDSITTSGAVGTNITVGIGLVVGLKARMAFANPVVHSNDEIIPDPTFSEGNSTPQDATNADQRASVTALSGEHLIVAYYPDRSRDGTGINFVLPDQRVPSVR